MYITQEGNKEFRMVVSVPSAFPPLPVGVKRSQTDNSSTRKLIFITNWVCLKDDLFSEKQLLNANCIWPLEFSVHQHVINNKY